jgi:hypothetical protein
MKPHKKSPSQAVLGLAMRSIRWKSIIFLSQNLFSELQRQRVAPPLSKRCKKISNFKNEEDQLILVEKQRIPPYPSPDASSNEKQPKFVAAADPYFFSHWIWKVVKQ